jgi:hypothetical protein
MALSVLQDRKSGPDWPLGNIIVVTPGTPVSIMSLVDSALYNAPETATLPQSDEYSVLCQQVIIQGFKGNGGVGLVPNAGNLYLCRKGAAGLGNRTDYGAIVQVILPGQTVIWASAAPNSNQFTPYRYYLDADNAGDAGQITLLIG